MNLGSKRTAEDSVPGPRDHLDQSRQAEEQAAPKPQGYELSLLIDLRRFNHHPLWWDALPEEESIEIWVNRARSQP